MKGPLFYAKILLFGEYGTAIAGETIDLCWGERTTHFLLVENLKKNLPTTRLFRQRNRNNN